MNYTANLIINDRLVDQVTIDQDSVELATEIFVECEHGERMEVASYNINIFKEE